MSAIYRIMQPSIATKKYHGKMKAIVAMTNPSSRNMGPIVNIEYLRIEAKLCEPLDATLSTLPVYLSRWN